MTSVEASPLFVCVDEKVAHDLYCYTRFYFLYREQNVSKDNVSKCVDKVHKTLNVCPTDSYDRRRVASSSIELALSQGYNTSEEYLKEVPYYNDVDTVRLYAFVERYEHWLSKFLYKYGKVSRQQVARTLSQLYRELTATP